MILDGRRPRRKQVFAAVLNRQPCPVCSFPSLMLIGLAVARSALRADDDVTTRGVGPPFRRPTKRWQEPPTHPRSLNASIRSAPSPFACSISRGASYPAPLRLEGGGKSVFEKQLVGIHWGVDAVLYMITSHPVISHMHSMPPYDTVSPVTSQKNSDDCGTRRTVRTRFTYFYYFLHI